CKLLTVGSPFFWQWEHPPLAVGTYTASENSILAVGMPCAFYSQHTTGSKSQQASASESAFVEEPVQTTSQIEEPLHPVFETGAEDQPIVQSSQHPEWFV
nr:hypothetical protein [Tanacetum cinerariifolium]